MFRRQTEVAVEGVLGVEVDTPALEIRIELLLCLPVLRVELVQVVVRDVERADVPLGLYNPRCPVLDGMVQQPVAHEVHQPVGRHAHTIFSEKLRVLLDERDDVIDFLLLGLETAFSLLRHDELVAADTPPIAVQTDIRGITQAVAPVQVVACVNQHILNVQPLQEVVVG